MDLVASPFELGTRGHTPLDVLAFAAKEQCAGHPITLAIVTAIEGSSARPVGALMAVSADEHCGYVSNGCIDASVAAHARETFSLGQMRRVRYGEGSPFIDIKLPCGGAIDIALIPHPDACFIEAAYHQLSARQPAALFLSPEGLTEGPAETAQRFDYVPALHLTIAGRGAETLALAQLARAAGYSVMVASPDADILERCATLGATVQALRFPGDKADFSGDPWSAFICLFHDHEWEPPLLREALLHDFFFVGAMGSRRTHQTRLAALTELGVHPSARARVRGPVGLIPATRDATTLAVSALAEIVDAYPGTDAL